MLILINTSMPKLGRIMGRGYREFIGRLLTPRHRRSLDTMVESGVPWAADNDCFKVFDEAAYRKMLASIAVVPGCLWVSAPDVVADAAATLALFDVWEPIIRSHGLPVALVGQDGLEALEVPWNRMDALFIGGTTRWKLGGAAASLVAEAKARGKWVHMGRCGTYNRILYAKRIGCDLVDSTAFSAFTNDRLPEGLMAARQTVLPIEEVPQDVGSTLPTMERNAVHE